MTQMEQSPNRLQHNNFDALRLLFAASVCLVHSYELSGFEALSWARGWMSGTAVQAFFVISGFLIFMSYERSSSFASYTSKRIRRIYPAYLAVIMLCAVGLFAVSRLQASEYFGMALVKYLIANLTFLNFIQQSLPGVFEDLRLSAVNGALWTIKIEAMFYVAVPVIAYLLKRLGRLPVIVTLYCASLAYTAGMAYMGARSGSGMYVELGRQLPGQMTYFMAGALLYYYLPVFERYAYALAAVAAAVLIAGLYAPLWPLQPLALGVVVVFAGLMVRPVLNAARYGDFSYGFYISHFPIIQLHLALGWFKASPWLFLASVLAQTTIASVLLWHGVEKHFLSKRNHYQAG